jgi:hypothetical protein
MENTLFNGDPLQAVISPTDDPNVFNLGDIDFNTWSFDGSRDIEVSMGPNMTSGISRS